MTTLAARTRMTLKRARRRQLACTSNKRASAQKNTSSMALARNQHEAPTRAPAVKAQATLCRFVVRSSIHDEPKTIQLVGASARGTATQLASRGQSAALPP